MKKMVVLALIIVSFLTTQIISGIASEKHYGELGLLDVSVEFLVVIPEGTCTIDGAGITCDVGNTPLRFNTPCPSKYWGAYPVYLAASTIPVKVIITDLGFRLMASHAIITEFYTMTSSGIKKDQTMQSSVINLDRSPGETRVIDASFTIHPVNEKLDIAAPKLYSLELYYDDGTNSANYLVINKKVLFFPAKSTM